jgi:hypothetical protein
MRYYNFNDSDYFRDIGLLDLAVPVHEISVPETYLVGGAGR